MYFLTFLQNLRDVVPLVLKKDLNLKPKNGGPKASSIRVPYDPVCSFDTSREKGCTTSLPDGAASCIIAMTMAFGKKFIILNAHKCGIRSEIAKTFMTLESGDAKSLNAAFKNCKNALHLNDTIDPFQEFASLDEMTNVRSENPANQAGAS